MTLGPFTGYGRRRRLRLDVPKALRSDVDVPAPPRKADCPGHVAGRDELGRYPVGDCSAECLLRRYRLGLARWDGERWA